MSLIFRIFIRGILRGHYRPVSTRDFGSRHFDVRKSTWPLFHVHNFRVGRGGSKMLRLNERVTRAEYDTKDTLSKLVGIQIVWIAKIRIIFHNLRVLRPHDSLFEIDLKYRNRGLTSDLVADPIDLNWGHPENDSKNGCNGLSKWCRYRNFEFPRAPSDRHQIENQP